MTEGLRSWTKKTDKQKQSHFTFFAMSAATDDEDPPPSLDNVMASLSREHSAVSCVRLPRVQLTDAQARIHFNLVALL